MRLTKAFSFLRHPLAKGTMTYGASTLIGKSIPFFLLPAMTRFLSPSDFGIVSTMTVYQAIISIIVDFGMANRISVNFFTTGQDRSALIRDAISVASFSTLTLLPLVWIGYSIFWNEIDISFFWIVLLVVMGGLKTITTIQMNVWQLEQQATKFSLMQILIIAFETLLILAFVFSLRFGWRGRIGANLFVTGVAGAFSILHLSKSNSLRVSLKDFKRLFPIAVAASPMIMHSFGGWLISSVDRMLISSLVSTSSTGIYSVAAQIASIIGFGTMAFNQAWSPFLFKTLAKGDSAARLKLVRFTYAYAAALFLFCFGFHFVARWGLLNFIDKRYAASIDYFPWLFGQAFFWGMYYMGTNYIFFANKTKLLAPLTLLTGLVSFFSGNILIRKFGVEGAAINVFVVSGVYAISVWVMSIRIFSMPWFEFSNILSVRSDRKH